MRGVLIATSSTLFFTAIKFMPMADALAIFFIEPFILTILSAVVDKEHVGWRRRIAVAAGFVGVLIVVRPSYDVFGAVSLIPAAGGALFAVYALLNRRLAAYDTPLTMQFTAGVSALAVMTRRARPRLALAGLPDLSPSPVGAREIGFLLLMGVLGTSGHLMFVQAAQLAPSSLIAPMQYVEILCGAARLFRVRRFPGFLAMGRHRHHRRVRRLRLLARKPPTCRLPSVARAGENDRAIHHLPRLLRSALAP